MIVKTRYLITMECAANLIKQGHFVWSPIVHCHELANQYTLPTDAEFWKDYNFDFIRKADAMFVLEIEGWQESKGVMMELKLADDARIPVWFTTPEGDLRKP